MRHKTTIPSLSLSLSSCSPYIYSLSLSLSLFLSAISTRLFSWGCQLNHRRYRGNYRHYTLLATSSCYTPIRSLGVYPMRDLSAYIICIYKGCIDCRERIIRERFEIYCTEQLRIEIRRGAGTFASSACLMKADRWMWVDTTNWLTQFLPAWQCSGRIYSRT